MSLQVFLQAQLLGAEDFLVAHARGGPDETSDFIGRAAWLSLYCEVLPRALLSELKLSRMLLGSSSAEQFLLVLAEEDIPRANDFLMRAAEAVAAMSGNTLRLIWASTENLGAWPVARKRLDDALLAKNSAPLAAGSGPDFFAPFSPAMDSGADHHFGDFAQGLPTAKQVGWSAGEPAHLTWDEGQHLWGLGDRSESGDDTILFPRRFAMDESGIRPASLEELAERADGAPRWGVLRGDVDRFESRLKGTASIEEHIHLSELFKEFFAGELSLLCTLGDFWRKVTIVYRGGDDFAVVGTWDALLKLALELQRLFEKFAEEHFASFAGLEGKTVSMALAIAPENETPLAAVFEDAGIQLRAAKAMEAGVFQLFGRALEWKRMRDAAQLKGDLMRLVEEFGYQPEYIHDLAAVHREAFPARVAGRMKPVRVDKPWRTYMRLSRVVPQSRGKEVSNLRNAVITDLMGKKGAGFKLRPSARVGLEWARLAAGD
ncbi:MAG: hypothetical protein JOY62_09315 [Acidobacteriaceae bacterium]|nr:hypothetical protein [Acidobacteriaceae bacterium]MBV9780158.1 hypothetical protein [Acidobacteriaceae bacterium]